MVATPYGHAHKLNKDKMDLSLEITVQCSHLVRIHITKNLNCCHPMRPMFTQHKKNRGKMNLSIKIIVLTPSTNTHYKKCELLPHHVHKTQTNKKLSLEIIIQYLHSVRKHTTKSAESLPPHTTNNCKTRKQKYNTFITRDNYAVLAFSAINKLQKVRIFDTPHKRRVKASLA